MDVNGFKKRASGFAAGTRSGFTLVELLTVVAIMGVLMSLLLAGVQACRETARRIKCANNMRNQVLALQEHCASHTRYPAGRTLTKAGEYSWCLDVLPCLDQSALLGSFDRTRHWSDPARNLAVADTNLAIFKCPSAITKFNGKMDYVGILGSLLPGFVVAGQENDNGVLIEIGARRRYPVSPGEISDGASHTILVAECCDREAQWGGRWISGFNCSSHNNGGINDRKGGDIHSLHPNGAYVGFADGRIQFLTENTDEFIIGSICTRAGGELTDEH